MMQITSFIGAALLLSAPVFATLGRVSLWGNGISPLIDPSLWANLKSQPSTSTQWAAGIIPVRCYEEATWGGFNATDIDVFSVSYADCNNFGPFVMCRHKKASLSQADMIDLFGRLPVHEREWVRHVIALPATAGSAYKRYTETVYQGPVGAPSVFQHETSHVLDSYYFTSQLSATFYWLNSIYADTCVADNYANTNEVEDFAQTGVVALFAAVNPGGMDSAFGQTWHCLLNQFNRWNYVIGTAVNPGGVCTRRWADSPIVSKTDGQVVKRSIRIPKILTADMPGVEEVPFKEEATTPLVRNYTNLVFNKEEKKKAELKQADWAKEAAKGANLAKRFKRIAKFQD